MLETRIHRDAARFDEIERLIEAIAGDRGRAVSRPVARAPRRRRGLGVKGMAAPAFVLAAALVGVAGYTVYRPTPPVTPEAVRDAVRPPPSLPQPPRSEPAAPAAVATIVRPGPAVRRWRPLQRRPVLSKPLVPVEAVATLPADTPRVLPGVPARHLTGAAQAAALAEDRFGTRALNDAELRRIEANAAEERANGQAVR